MFATLENIDSTCVKSLSVSPANNQVIVDYKSGESFLYNNVDFDAIIDLLCEEITSLGKFVNTYCKGNQEFRIINED